MEACGGPVFRPSTVQQECILTGWCICRFRDASDLSRLLTPAFSGHLGHIWKMGSQLRHIVVPHLVIQIGHLPLTLG